MAKKQDKDMVDSGAKVKLGASDRVIRGFGYAFMTIYAVCCIIPFIIIISTSFTSDDPGGRRSAYPEGFHIKSI